MFKYKNIIHTNFNDKLQKSHFYIYFLAKGTRENFAAARALDFLGEIFARGALHHVCVYNKQATTKKKTWRLGRKSVLRDEK